MSGILSFQFHVSASTVGLFFLLMCSLYAVCSPLWGKVCDRIEDSSPMMLLGLILSGLGLLLLGPSTSLGFQESYKYVSGMYPHERVHVHVVLHFDVYMYLYIIRACADM